MLRSARLLALAFIVAFGSLPAAAAPALTVADGGVFGAPYAHLGPRSTRAWENYRKKHDDKVPPWPLVFATNVSAGRVAYSNLYQGGGIGYASYNAPGLFVGTAVSQRTPPNARLSLVHAVQDGGRIDIETRAGFVEHLPAGGGAPANALITSMGGDNGMSDLFYRLPAGFGADALHINLLLSNLGPSWSVRVLGAYLTTATTTLWEPERLNHVAEVAVSGATPSGPDWISAISSDQSVALEWQLRQSGSQWFLEVVIGGQVTVSWLFDDGATRHGLTTTGNTDDAGYQAPYQNGSIDVSRLVPITYLGRDGQPSSLDGAPPTDLVMDISGAVPTLESVPAAVAAGHPFTFAVRALDNFDTTVASYDSMVGFSATDTAAALPAAFQFTPAEAGQSTFTATLNTPGVYRIRVFDTETPALESISTDIVVTTGAPIYLVGCDCSHGGGLAAAMVLASSILAKRRRRPATRPPGQS